MPDHTPAGIDTIVIDMVRKFSQDRLAPHAAAREKACAIEPEIIRELGELGIFGATTPAQWDGSEIDPVTYALLLEEIAAGDGSVSTMVSVHNSPTCIIFDQYGTDAQKDRWLRRLATGEHVGLVRADRAAGRLRRVQSAHACGEEGRPLRRQRRQAVHLLGRHSRQHGAVRGDRPVRRTQGHLLLRRRQIDEGLCRRAQGGKARPEGVRDERAAVRGHGGARGPAHRRRGRGLSHRAVHAGVGTDRHCRAERRHGARRAGLRGGVRQGAPGVRRPDHRPSRRWASVWWMPRPDWRRRAR